MDTILLQQDQYSVQSALMWGNCRAHFELFQREPSCNGRAAVQLTFAIIEAIPIISQIISLFEACIAWIYYTCCRAPAAIQQQPTQQPIQQSQPAAVRPQPAEQPPLNPERCFSDAQKRLLSFGAETIERLEALYRTHRLNRQRVSPETFTDLIRDLETYKATTQNADYRSTYDTMISDVARLKTAFFERVGKLCREENLSNPGYRNDLLEMMRQFPELQSLADTIQARYYNRVVFYDNDTSNLQAAQTLVNEIRNTVDRLTELYWQDRLQNRIAPRTFDDLLNTLHEYRRAAPNTSTATYNQLISDVNTLKQTFIANIQTFCRTRDLSDATKKAHLVEMMQQFPELQALATQIATPVAPVQVQAEPLRSKYDRQVILNLDGGNTARTISDKGNRKGLHSDIIHLLGGQPDYSPLRNLTERSRIYIIGHCNAGVDSIFSNGVRMSYIIYAEMIAVMAPQLVNNRHSLRVSAYCCYGGRGWDKNDLRRPQEHSSPSFCDKLSKALASKGILAEVQGRTGPVFQLNGNIEDKRVTRVRPYFTKLRYVTEPHTENTIVTNAYTGEAADQYNS